MERQGVVLTATNTLMAELAQDWFSGDEGRKEQIAPGQLADLAVLSFRFFKNLCRMNGDGGSGGCLQNTHFELELKIFRVSRKLDSATSYLGDAWILD